MWRKTAAQVQHDALLSKETKVDDAGARESLVDDAACAASVRICGPMRSRVALVLA
jgi:hypothetical protein